ncbi:CxxH/CxxC protein [Bacillus sp. B2-WWTP-C-10-Post-4]|uniref:CxxH/CxxC protein n=1 Tax=Bacillus sp. B2-WWTP-C-10-Post-4 TaxID=2653218 RepID=UPI00126220E9|nr:CxxH/CxxC protein [Bacillus sp. B2-WWTP-C-10-Post-4]KAB7654094.1 CxxH/CxxC protein [Bacillus sp. B2-WWTP-C-10-Post-4]
MNLPCCLEHVELALDIIVDECEVAPVINNVDNSGKEKKPCGFCQNEAIYVVSNTDSHTICG